jgi:hypothetical protein
VTGLLKHCNEHSGFYKILYDGLIDELSNSQLDQEVLRFNIVDHRFIRMKALLGLHCTLC